MKRQKIFKIKVKRKQFCVSRKVSLATMGHLQGHAEIGVLFPKKEVALDKQKIARFLREKFDPQDKLKKNFFEDVLEVLDAFGAYKFTNNTEEYFKPVTQPVARPNINFEDVYSRYPNKTGRSKGFRIFVEQVCNEKDLLSLNEAMERFRAYHVKQGTGIKFIPQFGTFMATWRDWARSSEGEVEDLSKKSEEQELLDLKKYIEEHS